MAVFLRKREAISRKGDRVFTIGFDDFHEKAFKFKVKVHFRDFVVSRG